MRLATTATVSAPRAGTRRRSRPARGRSRARRDARLDRPGRQDGRRGGARGRASRSATRPRWRSCSAAIEALPPGERPPLPRGARRIVPCASSTRRTTARASRPRRALFRELGVPLLARGHAARARRGSDAATQRAARRRGARDLRAARGDAVARAGRVASRLQRRSPHDLRSLRRREPRRREVLRRVRRGAARSPARTATPYPPGRRFCGECGAVDGRRTCRRRSAAARARRRAAPRLRPLRRPRRLHHGLGGARRRGHARAALRATSTPAAG